MSPQVIVDFLRQTGPEVCALFAALDPHAEAVFGVAWAGQDTSPNWFDLAREYTERWHHQQQIRMAVDAPLLTDRRWLHPFLDTSVRGLPHAYRDVQAPEGATVTIEIAGDAGDTWTLLHEADAWTLHAGRREHPTAHIRLADEIAWRLFSSMASPDAARKHIEVAGKSRLAEPLLYFASFMV